ncbi:transforming acidic coiled-coil-containing protein 2 isoform X3, partial [Arapaima gigas]
SLSPSMLSVAFLERNQQMAHLLEPHRVSMATEDTDRCRAVPLPEDSDSEAGDTPQNTAPGEGRAWSPHPLPAFMFEQNRDEQNDRTAKPSGAVSSQGELEIFSFRDYIMGTAHSVMEEMDEKADNIRGASRTCRPCNGKPQTDSNETPAGSQLAVAEKAVMDLLEVTQKEAIISTMQSESIVDVSDKIQKCADPCKQTNSVTQTMTKSEAKTKENIVDDKILSKESSGQRQNAEVRLLKTKNSEINTELEGKLKEAKLEKERFQGKEKEVTKADLQTLTQTDLLHEARMETGVFKETPTTVGPAKETQAKRKPQRSSPKEEGLELWNEGLAETDSTVDVKHEPERDPQKESNSEMLEELKLASQNDLLVEGNTQTATPAESEVDAVKETKPEMKPTSSEGVLKGHSEMSLASRAQMLTVTGGAATSHADTNSRNERQGEKTEKTQQEFEPDVRADAPVKPQSTVERSRETKFNAQIESQTESSTETSLGLSLGKSTETDIETQSQTEVAAQGILGTGLKTQTDMQAGFSTSYNIETELNIETDRQTELNGLKHSGLNTNTETCVKTEANTLQHTESGINVQTNDKIGLNAQGSTDKCLKTEYDSQEWISTMRSMATDLKGPQKGLNTQTNAEPSQNIQPDRQTGLEAEEKAKNDEKTKTDTDEGLSAQDAVLNELTDLQTGFSAEVGKDINPTEQEGLNRNADTPRDWLSYQEQLTHQGQSNICPPPPGLENEQDYLTALVISPAPGPPPSLRQKQPSTPSGTDGPCNLISGVAVPYHRPPPLGDGKNDKNATPTSAALIDLSTSEANLNPDTDGRTGAGVRLGQKNVLLHGCGNARVNSVLEVASVVAAALPLTTPTVPETIEGEREKGCDLFGGAAVVTNSQAVAGASESIVPQSSATANGSEIVAATHQDPLLISAKNHCSSASPEYNSNPSAGSCIKMPHSSAEREGGEGGGGLPNSSPGSNAHSPAEGRGKKRDSLCLEDQTDISPIEPPGCDCQEESGKRLEARGGEREGREGKEKSGGETAFRVPTGLTSGTSATATVTEGSPEHFAGGRHSTRPPPDVNQLLPTLQHRHELIASTKGDSASRDLQAQPLNKVNECNTASYPPPSSQADSGYCTADLVEGTQRGQSVHPESNGRLTKSLVVALKLPEAAGTGEQAVGVQTRKDCKDLGKASLDPASGPPTPGEPSDSPLDRHSAQAPYPWNPEAENKLEISSSSGQPTVDGEVLSPAIREICAEPVVNRFAEKPQIMKENAGGFKEPKGAEEAQRGQNLPKRDTSSAALGNCASLPPLMVQESLHHPVVETSFTFKEFLSLKKPEMPPVPLSHATLPDATTDPEQKDSKHVALPSSHTNEVEGPLVEPNLKDPLQQSNKAAAITSDTVLLSLTVSDHLSDASEPKSKDSVQPNYKVDAVLTEILPLSLGGPDEPLGAGESKQKDSKDVKGYDQQRKNEDVIQAETLLLSGAVSDQPETIEAKLKDTIQQSDKVDAVMPETASLVAAVSDGDADAGEAKPKDLKDPDQPDAMVTETPTLTVAVFDKLTDVTEPKLTDLKKPIQAYQQSSEVESATEVLTLSVPNEPVGAGESELNDVKHPVQQDNTNAVELSSLPPMVPSPEYVFSNPELNNLKHTVQQSSQEEPVVVKPIPVLMTVDNREVTCSMLELENQEHFIQQRNQGEAAELELEERKLEAARGSTVMEHMDGMEVTILLNETTPADEQNKTASEVLRSENKHRGFGLVPTTHQIESEKEDCPRSKVKDTGNSEEATKTGGWDLNMENVTAAKEEQTKIIKRESLGLLDKDQTEKMSISMLLRPSDDDLESNLIKPEENKSLTTFPSSPWNSDGAPATQDSSELMSSMIDESAETKPFSEHGEMLFQNPPSKLQNNVNDVMSASDVTTADVPTDSMKEEPTLVQSELSCAASARAKSEAPASLSLTAPGPLLCHQDLLSDSELTALYMETMNEEKLHEAQAFSSEVENEKQPHTFPQEASSLQQIDVSASLSPSHNDTSTEGVQKGEHVDSFPSESPLSAPLLADQSDGVTAAQGQIEKEIIFSASGLSGKERGKWGKENSTSPESKQEEQNSSTKVSVPQTPKHGISSFEELPLSKREEIQLKGTTNLKILRTDVNESEAESKLVCDTKDAEKEISPLLDKLSDPSLIHLPPTILATEPSSLESITAGPHLTTNCVTTAPNTINSYPQTGSMQESTPPTAATPLYCGSDNAAELLNSMPLSKAELPSDQLDHVAKLLLLKPSETSPDVEADSLSTQHECLSAEKNLLVKPQSAEHVTGEPCSPQPLRGQDLPGPTSTEADLSTAVFSIQPEGEPTKLDIVLKSQVSSCCFPSALTEEKTGNDRRHDRQLGNEKQRGLCDEEGKLKKAHTQREVREKHPQEKYEDNSDPRLFCIGVGLSEDTSQNEGLSGNLQMSLDQDCSSVMIGKDYSQSTAPSPCLLQQLRPGRRREEASNKDLGEGVCGEGQGALTSQEVVNPPENIAALICNDKVTVTQGSVQGEAEPLLGISKAPVAVSDLLLGELSSNVEGTCDIHPLDMLSSSSTDNQECHKPHTNVENDSGATTAMELVEGSARISPSRKFQASGSGSLQRLDNGHQETEGKARYIPVGVSEQPEDTPAQPLPAEGLLHKSKNLIDNKEAVLHSATQGTQETETSDPDDSSYHRDLGNFGEAEAADMEPVQEETKDLTLNKAGKAFSPVNHELPECFASSETHSEICHTPGGEEVLSSPPEAARGEKEHLADSAPGRTWDKNSLEDPSGLLTEAPPPADPLTSSREQGHPVTDISLKESAPGSPGFPLHPQGSGSLTADCSRVCLTTHSTPALVPETGSSEGGLESRQVPPAELSEGGLEAASAEGCYGFEHSVPEVTSESRQGDGIPQTELSSESTGWLVEPLRDAVGLAQTEQPPDRTEGVCHVSPIQPLASPEAQLEFCTPCEETPAILGKEEEQPVSRCSLTGQSEAGDPSSNLPDPLEKQTLQPPLPAYLLQEGVDFPTPPPTPPERCSNSPPSNEPPDLQTPSPAVPDPNLPPTHCVDVLEAHPSVLPTRSSDSDGAFETPESTTPVKAATPPLPPPEPDVQSLQLPSEDTGFCSDSASVTDVPLSETVPEPPPFSPPCRSNSTVFDEDKPIASSGAYNLDLVTAESFPDTAFGPQTTENDSISRRLSTDCLPQGRCPLTRSLSLQAGELVEPDEGSAAGVLGKPSQLRAEAFSIGTESAPGTLRKTRKARPPSLKKKPLSRQSSNTEAEKKAKPRTESPPQDREEQEEEGASVVTSSEGTLRNKKTKIKPESPASNPEEAGQQTPVSPVHPLAPISPTVPDEESPVLPKGSYKWDPDNFEGIDPFQTGGSKVLNSPVLCRKGVPFTSAADPPGLPEEPTSPTPPAPPSPPVPAAAIPPEEQPLNKRQSVRLEFDYTEEGEEASRDTTPPPKRLGKKPGAKMPLRKPKLGVRKPPPADEPLDNISTSVVPCENNDDIPVPKGSYSFDPSNWDDPDFNPFSSGSGIPNSPRLARTAYNFDPDTFDDAVDPFKTSDKMGNSPPKSSTASFEVSVDDNDNESIRKLEDLNQNKPAKKKKTPLKSMFSDASSLCCLFNTFRVKKSPKRSSVSETSSQEPTPLSTPDTPPVVPQDDHATDEEKLASSTNQKWAALQGVEAELTSHPQDYPQPSDLTAFVNENSLDPQTHVQDYEIEYMEKIGSSTPPLSVMKPPLYLKLDSVTDSPAKSSCTLDSEPSSPCTGSFEEMEARISAGGKSPVLSSSRGAPELTGMEKSRKRESEPLSHTLSSELVETTPSQDPEDPNDTLLLDRLVESGGPLHYLEPDLAETNPTAFAQKLQSHLKKPSRRRWNAFGSPSARHQREAISPAESAVSKGSLYARTGYSEGDSSPYLPHDLDHSLGIAREEIVTKEKEVAEWQRKYEESRQEVVEMRRIVAEYEKTITQMIEDGQREKSLSHHTIQQLIVEKDQALADLNSVEKSLADLFRRYEKMKDVLEGFRKNEEVLKKCAQEYLSRIRKEEQRYQALKIHAEEKLDKANADIAQVRAKAKQEQAAYQASLRKEQMKVESLERTLEQKNKEIEELTKICDELISKMGKS